MQLPVAGDLFLSKYRLQSVIGEGGFARVFRAEDAAGRLVAIKILLPDETAHEAETAARFAREVQIVGGLRDPHTVTMYESGRTPEGLRYMVFEHVPGHDLSMVIERQGRLAPRETLHVMRQMLMSLREAHSAGLLHRDIKPANIRVFEYMGDPWTAKLLDFGIAKRPGQDRGATITKAGELVGTPRYMSPEQLMGQPLTPASDIYSLGLVMFEMLLGPAALQGNRWSDQLERLQGGYRLQVPEMEKLGAGLLEVLHRMSARDAAERYASADAVLSALAALERGDSSSSSVTAIPPTREVRPRFRGSTTLWAVLGAVVVLIAIAVVILAQRFSAVPEPVPVATVRPLPAALLKGFDPAPEPKREPEHDVIGRRDGCGKPPAFREFGWFQRPHPWTVYVPESYDPKQRTPVVFVAYPDHITPDTFIRQTRLPEVAEKEGFLIISPDVGEVNAWVDPQHADVMRDVFEAATDEFCIDRGHVFVLGHNNGGKVVEALSCEPWVTAVAFNSFRPRVDEQFCDATRAKPALVLSPMETGHAPIEGGENCYGSIKLSLEAYESGWKARNGCTGPARLQFRHERSECFSWQCSQARFVACHLDGGLGWPGTKTRVLADWRRCDGVPPQFPTQNVVWDFFESVAPSTLDEP